ncbi:c-type cytochrome [Pseudooceanicola nanhaiensis]|uniref:c-type cytochrome n=1 Tax=Pseudooceanicola nanhaiensis TaxID=375761 RepID=UPI001CD61A09|nr:cytochrome c family protein [Pseudooceanicola nanhaiensis]MCA0919294.1 cytochrome c family protein [Pseudooceanicola nanhaiensis]
MQKIGTLVLLGLLAAEPLLAQDAAEGETVFQRRCSACHTIDGANRVGPSLQGVVGRDAGTFDGFRYSGAMEESGLMWDAETLMKYLENPRDMVPGTRMVLRLPDEEDRRNVVEFLATR